MKRGPAKVFVKGVKMVKVDTDTHQRLRFLATKDGLSIAQYIRSLSRVAVDEIEHPEYDKEAKDMLAIANQLWDAAGLPDNREKMPDIDLKMIETALIDQPQLKRVGWYDLDEYGAWLFNYERYDEWNKAQRE